MKDLAGPGRNGRARAQTEWELGYHLSPALPASAWVPSTSSIFPTPTSAYSPDGHARDPSGLPVLSIHLPTASPPPTPPGSCLKVFLCISLSLGQLFPKFYLPLPSFRPLRMVTFCERCVSPDPLGAHRDTATPHAPCLPSSIFPYDTPPT